MDRVELSASTRQLLGKKVRFLRRQGITPANLYGHGLKSTALQIETLHLKHVLAQAGKTGLIAFKVDDETQPKTVMVRDVQRDPRNGELLHVDLYQVRMDEKIRLEIPLRFIGEAPAVKSSGGILLQNLNSLEVECLASALSASIEVDLSSLAEIDQALHVRDIPVPEMVTVLTDPEQLVVKIMPSRVDVAGEVPAAKAEVEEMEK